MSGTEKTLEKLKDRAVPLVPLLNILECPVCLVVVNIPFKQCQRGHLICNACLKPRWNTFLILPHCPSCKSKLAMDSPVCMKQLIEALPRMCRHSRAGCEEIVEPKSDHELLYCGYRPVECELCKQITLVCQLRQHLADEHADRPFFISSCGRFSLFGFEGKTREIYVGPVFIKNTLFWLKIRLINKDTFEISFEGVFSCKPTDDYYITLKFEKDNVGPRVSLKASEDPKKYHEESDILCSIKMLRKTVRRCIDDQDVLRIGYELCAKPKSRD